MSESPLDRRQRSSVVDMIDRAVAHDDAIGRRAFVTLLTRNTGTTLAAAFGASLLAACGAEGTPAVRSALRTAQRRNETVERWLFRHTRMDHARADATLAGSSFPAYHVAPVLPTWDESTRGPWSLAVTGDVARPQRFTLAALVGMPAITQRVDHFCVEGWNAVARWSGVRLRDLASLVGARPTAQYVDFRSFDVDHGVAYHECWDIESATHPQTLIAYGLDGHYLGAAHGAPARVHSPVKLGYKNTKYLTEVAFLTNRAGGYWSDQGYEWYGGT